MLPTYHKSHYKLIFEPNCVGPFNKKSSLAKTFKFLVFDR